VQFVVLGFSPSGSGIGAGLALVRSNNLFISLLWRQDNMWTINQLWARSSSRVNRQQRTAKAVSTVFESLESRRLLSAISIADATANEGSNLSFTVSLDAPATTLTTVKFTTAAKTAKFNKNFTKTSGTLTFNPGDSTQTITVPTIDDNTDAPNKTMTVHLAAAGKGNKITRATATGTIVDIDAAPTVTINSISVNEPRKGIATGKFRIGLSGATEFPVTVNFATADGTATVAQGDYIATQGKVTFRGKKNSALVNVRIKHDTATGSNEAFTLGLTSAINATIDPNNNAGTCTILDGGVSNPPPTPGGSGKFNASTFTWTSHGHPQSDMVVNFAVKNTGTTAITGAQVQYFFAPQGANLNNVTPYQTQTLNTIAPGATLNSGNISVPATNVTTTSGFWQFVARLVVGGVVQDTNFGPILQV
jgi:hypothetical protein